MFFDQDITRSNFFIRLKSWEYWPFGIIQLPVIAYFFWLSLRARSFLFFTASNPGIVMGGMFGESKYDVLKKVPPQLIPTTIFIKVPRTTADVIARMRENGMSFPVIFKPDLGERGFMVQRIDTESDIDTYLRQMKHSFVIQELIDLPLEFGVFYSRFPDDPKGKVTSVVMKEMLSVTGDGVSTLQQLILQKDRAKLQWERLKKKYSKSLSKIITHGETIELVSIGNHSLGTKFLDGNHLINDKLSDTFDEVSKQIEGFYFGRFDLRCRSLEDLYTGNVKVLELNGCGAEPAHIYHPGYSPFKAIGVLIEHWRNIFLIARENARRGTTYVPFREAKVYYKKFKTATQVS
jgi:hypothetical protein